MPKEKKKEKGGGRKKRNQPLRVKKCMGVFEFQKSGQDAVWSIANITRRQGRRKKKEKKGRKGGKKVGKPQHAAFGFR